MRNNRIAKLWALNWDQRRLLLAALITVPWVSMSLRLRGLRGCAAASRGSGLGDAGRMPVDEAVCRARAAADLVRAAASFYGARCLVQALTLQRLLGRRGIVTELSIGVNRQDGRFGAHAWLEIDGVPVNDAEGISERFAPFTPLEKT
jgi:hypothetical protein